MKIWVGRKRKPNIYRTACGREVRPEKFNKTAGYLDALVLDPTAIYVMESGSMAKIGRSCNPQERSNGIQTGNGQHVRLVWHRWLSKADAIALETKIHRDHRGTDVHSMGEWYYLSTPAAIDLVERYIRQMGLWACSDEIARKVA